MGAVVTTPAAMIDPHWMFCGCTNSRVATGRVLAPPDPMIAAMPGSAAGVARMAALSDADASGLRKEVMNEQRDVFADEQAMHLEVAARSDCPYRERLVAVWANHFTVSIARKKVAFTASSFERDVIRAHLGGTFEEMLVASTRHPAMLIYLDNHRSIGPNSPAGVRKERGLNENLAREVLELHTLGSRGGYEQADVEAFARVLTGWTVDVDGEPPGFAFDPRRHEPGTQRVVGVQTEGRGEADGLQVLRALAHHPSTARHVATRLVRHFVADTPPPAAVDAVAQAFLTSGGHLPTVHRALIPLPSAWVTVQPKVRAPWDLVLGASRALGAPDGRALLASMRLLGQVPYSAPSPEGWPDTTAGWIGPEALLLRLDWAAAVAQRISVGDVAERAEDVLGPVLDAATRRRLREAQPEAALALMLACPAFQRR